MHRRPLREWTFSSPALTEKVTLPHCWNRAEEGADYYRGACRYGCLLPGPLFPDRDYYLEFEGAASVARVRVNGRTAGEHRGAYGAFRFNITPLLREGENILDVSVDNSPFEDVYPLMADFAFMGGLYRPVWLLEAEKTRFSLDDFGSPGVYIRSESVDARVVRFSVEAPITLHSSTPEPSCRCEIQSPRGEKLFTETGEVKGERISFSFELENPELWAGRDSPSLYTAVLTLLSRGVTIDRRREQTGFRIPRADPERGFFLNGEPYPLRGVSRHQDRDGAGMALSPEHQKEDLDLIAEMGANAIRLAHYQHRRDFYRLCDREGFVVWAEIPYISRTSREDVKGANAFLQLEELIRQNYNSPSICFWGLQNEITIGGRKKRAAKITAELHRRAKELDPLRLTGQSQVGHYPDDGRMNGMTDVLGYNKYYGWYYGKTSDLAPWLEDFARKNPDISLGITEYGAEGRTCYHSASPRLEDYTEEYQALYHERTLALLGRHPRLWGSFVWNMFDFASPMRDEGGMKGMNNKGLVSYDRKTKKDAFFYYKACWNGDPMIHITGKRFFRRQGRHMEVKAYTNGKSVRLEVNGRFRVEEPAVDNIALFRSVPLKRRGLTHIKAVALDERGERIASDTAQFNRVRRAVKEYVCPEQDPFHFLKNWFEEEPEENLPPLEFPEGRLSVRDKIRVILKSPEGEKIIRKYAGPLYDHPMFPMARGFSPEKLTELRPGTVPDSFLFRLNEELVRIRKD